MDSSLDANKSFPGHQQQADNIMTKIICFNMGGKIYKVSHSFLFGMNPNSRIAQIASEHLQSQSSPEDDIVLEWDGDRLRFVLQYLQREGKVKLPKSVPKGMFLDCLAHYGIMNVDESKIIQNTSRAIFYYHLWSNEVRAEIKSWDVSSAIALLAHECVSLYMKSGDKYDVTIYGPGSTLPLQGRSYMCSDETFVEILSLFCNDEKIILPHDQEECNQHLYKVGLEMISAVALSEKCIIQVVVKLTDI